MAYTPTNPNGQATSANSSPVVVASDQSKIKVDLTDTTANAVAIKVDGAKAEDAAAASGDNGIPILAVRNDAAASKTSADGDYSMLATDSAGRVGIADLGGNIMIKGDVAHDAAAGANPVGIGGYATTDIAAITTVANNDRTHLYSDIHGRLIVTPYSGPENIKSGTATLTGTGNTAVIAAGAASVRTYVTSISVSNTSATGVRVDVKDGTTTVWSSYLAANGGGATIGFPTPIRGTAATAVNAALSAAVTDVRVQINGFQLKG